MRGSLADAGRALRVSPAELFAGGEARPGFHAQADQAIEKHRGMTDSNFLQDALRAAATELLDTCTLCGAIINRPYEDAHNHFHHADYQPFATATPGAAAVTCKLCGILINRSYWDTHNRGHG